jgi:hypothetical protein
MRFALSAGVVLTAVGCAAGTSEELSGPSVDAARGALLYDTACAACHTTQAHWRDKRVVHSWSELIFQVTRWQQVAGQNWRADQVADVAAFLNRRFYGLACPSPGCTGPAASLHGEQQAASF